MEASKSTSLLKTHGRKLSVAMGHCQRPSKWVRALALSAGPASSLICLPAVSLNISNNHRTQNTIKLHNQLFLLVTPQLTSVFGCSSLLPSRTTRANGKWNHCAEIFISASILVVTVYSLLHRFKAWLCACFGL